MSNEQYTLKKKADIIVPGEYGLRVDSTDGGNTSEVIDMVEWLSNDLMFVYPCKPKVCHCCHDVILGRRSEEHTSHV